MPILTEVGGTVKFEDIIEGVTMTEQLDEVTGLSRRSDHRVARIRTPVRASRIKDEKGETQAHPGHRAATRATSCRSARTSWSTEGDEVAAGRRHRQDPARDHEDQGHHRRSAARGRALRGPQAQGARDHHARSTASCPSARTPRASARWSSRRRSTASRAPTWRKEYLIAKGKHISVHAGDRVQAGEPLMDGAANPHDILKVLGEKELARYLVDEVQEVYRLQGVKINDKHIETIVRQMLRRVRVTDVGDTDFLVDEQVEKWVFEEENEKVLQKGGKRRRWASRCSSASPRRRSRPESFISASSFQETTKVLTEAAITGKVDHLRGLKENVIMGRLIPAGTGLRSTSTSTSRWRRRSTLPPKCRRPRPAALHRSR